jgi:hypothetical protein
MSSLGLRTSSHDYCHSAENSYYLDRNLFILRLLNMYFLQRSTRLTIRKW